MNEHKTRQALNLYIILGGLFIAALVGSNLIFQKFFWWQPFKLFGSDYTFEISVGIIAYPITFLVTDLISELFGKRMANKIVVAGIISAIFIYLLVSLATIVPHTEWSPVKSETFDIVFGLTGPAVFASMCAYLIAQFIDIRLYHFWKNLTKGKHLWMRNNLSTIPSQLIDTAVVLLLLCVFQKIEWVRFIDLLINGFLYKVMFAIIDTPILYLIVHFARSHFRLDPGQEIDLGSLSKKGNDLN
ncbi:MAG: queuosine precursor transporter [Flavobacteriales bacterium]|nr:queuosine precursor transporter [Flavobacteriales bacterium]